MYCSILNTLIISAYVLFLCIPGKPRSYEFFLLLSDVVCAHNVLHAYPQEMVKYMTFIKFCFHCSLKLIKQAKFNFSNIDKALKQVRLWYLLF